MAPNIRPPGPSFTHPSSDFSRYPGSSPNPGSTNPYPSTFPTPYTGSPIGVPNITTPSGQPSFFRPTVPISYPTSSTPSFLPPPSSASFHPTPLQGRTEWINPPSLPQGSTPAWVTASLPSPLFTTPRSDYQINRSAVPSAVFQPLNPPSFHYPSSLTVSSPTSSLTSSPFSRQTPSLSGRAVLTSSFSSLEGATSFMPQRAISWTSPSSSKERPAFSSDRTVAKWTPGTSFLQNPRTHASKAPLDPQLRLSMLRQLEETSKIMYQMHPSPERPFAPTMPQLAFQLDQHTTLFVDPMALTDFFQRATSTQRQAVQTQFVQFMGKTAQAEHRAVIQDKYERVVLHINDLPSIGGGQGIGGHAFLEFPDRKITLGNYPGELRTDDSKSINKKTTSIECYCETAKVEKSLDIMRHIKWTTSKNCVYTVVEGMKTMEFIHAEKIELSKLLPLPSELRSQMLKFHGHDPMIITYPREKIVIKHPHPKTNDEVKE